ncbi:MAG: DUF2500 family protein [Ruminococcus sp.]|nr:DUF2500 family protein [Ruminococcus sp.]MDE6501170.1 DUF2500 family protein [Ruminococcus sp.]MDE6679184.1 DUF2500 family protein [Ruminococcus sp.]
MLIMFGAIAIALILIIITFGGDNPVERFISLFIEEEDENTEEVEKKSFSAPVVEMATLIRKSDDRRRVIESDGNVKLLDEYYELTFLTRKGRNIKIECSAEVYEKIPFNQQGSLTYRKNKLVKFKYYEDTVYNEN